MPNVRKKVAAHQRSPKADVPPPAASVSDRSVAVSLIHVLIPLGLKASEVNVTVRDSAGAADVLGHEIGETGSCATPPPEARAGRAQNVRIGSNVNPASALMAAGE